MSVSHAYIVTPVGDAPAVMYVTVRNQTGRADTLLGVTTAVAQRAELHRNMAGQSGRADAYGATGMTMMMPIARLPIGQGDVLRLVPGGNHVMLLHPSTLNRGDSVVVALHFSRAGTIPATVAVIGYADVDTAVGHLK